MSVQPPASVSARGTMTGAIIIWTNRQQHPKGFNIYRDGQKLNAQPLRPRNEIYQDWANGQLSYAVTALAEDGSESSPSLPCECLAGSADHEAPRVFVISPQQLCAPASRLILRRVLSKTAYGLVSAVFHYRVPVIGVQQDGWTDLPMQRRSKAIFAARIPAPGVTSTGIEYYISASDGSNTGMWPAAAPAETRLVVIGPSGGQRPSLSGPKVWAEDSLLKWTPGDPAPHEFRIYRGSRPDFKTDRSSYLTYVAGSTSQFSDRAEDFEGKPLRGAMYYRITAVDINGSESAPSEAAPVLYTPAQCPPKQETKAVACSAESLTEKMPCSEGWYALHMGPRSWIRFDRCDLGESPRLVLVRFSSTGNPGMLEIRLDNPLVGDLISTISITSTGGPQQWASRGAPVSLLQPAAPIYLKATTDVNLHWIRFVDSSELGEADWIVHGARS